MSSSLLVLASAVIVFALGLVRLLITFRGPKLRPRSAALLAQMQADSPGITRQTSMWRAWLGFNASHSLGAMLYGAVYGYFALCQPQLLFGSAYLSLLGAALLSSYLWLARRYWFSAPLAGISLASICYAAAYALLALQ